MCSTISSLSSTLISHLPLQTTPRNTRSTQQPPPSALSVSRRRQKCNYRVTHRTKDTSQLPQALSISQIWFPFVQVMAFLLSPALRAHPPHQTITSMQWPFPRSPGTEQKEQIIFQLPAVAPLDKGLHLQGGVCSGVVAMVNMSSNK